MESPIPQNEHLQPKQQDPTEIEKMVQEIINYQKYVSAASEENLLKELNEVALYDLDKIGSFEQIHILLLSIHPKVSTNDMILLKSMLERPDISPNSIAQTDELAAVLSNIAKAQIALRLRDAMLNKEIAENLKQNIILNQTVMEYQKQAENLQKQIEDIKNIEKIIIQREKPDLPTQ